MAYEIDLISILQARKISYSPREEEREKESWIGPKDIPPRIGTDTLSPDLPSCTYDTFVSSKLE